MRTFVKFVIYILLLFIAAVLGYFFLWPEGKYRDILSFIPEDFVYAIESNRPVESWREINESEIWQYLKSIDYLEEVSNSADSLDVWIQENRKVLDLVRLGDMVISAHITSFEKYEFLILIDLREKNLSKFNQLIKLAFSQLGYSFTVDSYFNIDIFDLNDPEDGQTLSLSVVDNILIASYDKNLLKRSILQTEERSITENEDFALVRERTYGDGTYTLYLNYALLNKFVGLYTEQIPELLVDIPNILSFSSFEISLGDKLAVFGGYLKHMDSVPSFMNVFLDVGQGKMLAENVLPFETAMFTSLGFEDFSLLFEKFTQYYAETDSLGFQSWQKTKDRTERLLNISVEEDFFSWMTEEMVAAIIPTTSNKDSFYQVALLHFDDYDFTKEKLLGVERKVKKRTPLKFSALDYRGFTIKFLEVKSFFNFFLRGLFADIQKPHYTFIDDYVVFANDTSSLKQLIDSYLQERVLAASDNYEDFMGNFSSSSNVFIYLQQETFYPYFRQQLDRETQGELSKYKAYVKSFPQIGFQLYPGGKLYEAFLLGEFVRNDSNSELWE